MTRIELKHTLILLAVLHGCLFPSFKVSAQNFFQQVYTPSDLNFPNPERGFYHHREVHSSLYAQLTKSELLNYRNEGITLVMRVFYLESFVNGDISNQYLNNVRQDFSVARNAGVKLIVRFAYTTNSSPPFRDATPERVLAHITQLSPLLRENSDVIALVQAGFIGAWGEWYYTDHFSQFVGTNNETNWADRRAVVNALLDAVPLTRTVQIRTPYYKRKITETQDALTADEAFTGSMRSRLGHHNDCFISSSTDVGTYTNVVEEKNYIEQETNFVPIGGETCAVSVPRSECPNALAELERMHWSFLNEDYFPQVITGFETGGCMPDIRKKLGYRYRLTKGSLQQTGMPGGTFDIALSLINEGWANVYNPRWVEIVLRNDVTGKEYFFKTNEDPRRWSLSDTIKINQSLGLPENIEDGTYSIHLNLPDPETSLYNNPSFSIRLANNDVWEDQTGYNSLGGSIIVDPSTSTPSYLGSNFFKQRNEFSNTLQPSPILASSTSNEVILYWGVSQGDSYRVIQRKHDDAEFETVAILAGNQFYFKDKDVLPNASYKYRYYFKSDNLISDVTPEAVQETKVNNPMYYEFNVDNSHEEWEFIPPLATAYKDSETFALRIFADRDSLNILLQGDGYTSYEIFIDTDNLSATGINEFTWQANGFDYKIKDDALFKALGGVWSFVKAIHSEKISGFREVSVSLSEFENLEHNIIFNAAAAIQLTGGSNVALPFEGEKPSVYIRSLPSPTPTSFAVSNSESIPESRLVIEWDNECSNCTGFVLEKSLDALGEFNELFRGTTGNLYRDDGLTVNTTYYYRMFFYNETGKSEYSEVMPGTTHAVVVTGNEKQVSAIRIYPNPVENLLHVRSEKPLDLDYEIGVFDALGKPVPSHLIEKVSESGNEKVLNLSKLLPGIYIIWINQSGQRHHLRILKI